MTRDRRSKKKNNNWKNNQSKNENQEKAGFRGNDRNNRNDRHDRNERNDRNLHNNQNDDRLFKLKKEPTIKHKHTVSQEQIRADEEAIRQFKTSNQPICPICNQPITDMSSAITRKGQETPSHFDCAHQEALKEEKLGPGEKLIYIGQGRFGVVFFENPHDTKHFQIRKIIDWEDRDNRSEWRNVMAELYSHVR